MITATHTHTKHKKPYKQNKAPPNPQICGICCQIESLEAFGNNTNIGKPGIYSNKY